MGCSPVCKHPKSSPPLSTAAHSSIGPSVARRPVPTLYLAPYNPFPVLSVRSQLSLFPKAAGLPLHLPIRSGPATPWSRLQLPSPSLTQPSAPWVHRACPHLSLSWLPPSLILPNIGQITFPHKIANPHHHSPTIFYVIHGIAFPKHKCFLVLSSLAGFLPRMYENIHENVQAP